jgi:ABC-type branched-subunit amino acid transport system substrate-binding protein
MKAPVLGVIVVLAAALLLASTASASDPLTPAEKRGREIYLHGQGSGKPMTAYFGADGAGEISASVAPCASCHGADGRGVPEGTVAPSDIRWSVLARPFVWSDGSRHRPRYDEAMLTRSVRRAIDAAGTPLYAVMPRYGIDDRDLSDLLGYLYRLGDEPQPGLSDDAIAVATVVPLSGRGVPAGDAARSVIQGYFDDINAQGGLFGRQLKLQTLDANGPAKDIAAALAGPLFGVVGASWPPDALTLDGVIAAERIPLVTPFVTAVESRSAVSSFFLFPDPESQALALIDFAAERAGNNPMRIALVDDGSPLAEAAAGAAERHSQALGWTVSRDVAADADLLLVVGNADMAALGAKTKSSQILLAGASVTRSLFELRGKKVFLAAPTLPGDLTSEGRGEIESFAIRHSLDPKHRAAEIAAYAAVKVFVEGLRRAGRDLTREKLIASLEHLYGFATGVTPAITYGPSRHVGTIGTYVVEVDFDRKTFGAPSRWITPEQ